MSTQAMRASLRRTIEALSANYAWAQKHGTSADRRRTLAQLEAARAELIELDAHPNPLARHDYPRRAALQRDLERYYSDCRNSSTAHHLQGGKSRRAEYCSGVAWKRVHLSGRYKDYPTMRENPLGTGLAVVGVLGAAVVGYLVYKSSKTSS